MTRCLSGAMPMPVSRTAKPITCSAVRSFSLRKRTPSAGVIRSSISPSGVNLNAFESRFLSTCWSRFGSVWIASGSPSSRLMVKARARSLATSRNIRSRSAASPSNGTGSGSTGIAPDSIFERSRISLMRARRSEPEE